MVPAIVSDNLVPMGYFKAQLGPQIEEYVFLPSTICFLIFALSALICFVQRRYWLIILLSPWLVLSFVQVSEMSSELPNAREARAMWQLNQQLSRENLELPKVADIRDRFNQIRFTDSELLTFDREKLSKEIDRLADGDAVSNSDLGKLRNSVAGQLQKVGAQIKQTNVQIRIINQSLRRVDSLYRFSFGLFDKHLKKKLYKGLRQVKKHRDRLIAKQHALRDKLKNIDQTLVSLVEVARIDAEVNSHLWLSQSYQSWYLTLLYSSMCFLALLIIIWQFSLGSWMYLFVLVASAISATLYLEAPPTFKIWVIIKLIIISLLIKIAYRLYAENMPLLRQQTWKFNLLTLAKTLVYYWLFILFILLGWYASVLIEDFIDDQLYAIKPVINSDQGNNTRRYDVDVALDTHFKEQEDALLNDLDTWATQSKRSVADVENKTVSLYEDTIVETLPEIDSELAPPGCTGFLPWLTKTGQCAENSVLEPLNTGYTEERNDQRDSLRATANDATKQAGKNVDKAIAFAKQNLSDALMRIKRTIKQQLEILYLAIDITNWVSLLMLITAIIKSFMYIFARIFFSNTENQKRIIQFEPIAEPKHQGEIREVSDTLRLTPEMGQQLYLNKHYDFSNAPPDEVTPQASKAFFSRFKNGVWHLNKVNMKKGDDELPYRRIPDDERIVVWTIKPGDAVVFSWKTFVGMNDNIKITTRFSWQLSSLIFGRMFFVVATVDETTSSDGTLLLSARGSDGIRESSNPSNNPDQLLAWQTTTRFDLYASLSMRNIYRSGIQVKARPNDLAVMHLSERKRRSGAIAWLKYFVVPI